jgi:hypothetical protein
MVCTLDNNVTYFRVKARYGQYCWWFARSTRAWNRLPLWGRSELHTTRIEKERQDLKNERVLLTNGHHWGVYIRMVYGQSDNISDV